MRKGGFYYTAVAVCLSSASAASQTIDWQSHLSAQGRYSVRDYNDLSPLSPTGYSRTSRTSADVDMLFTSQFFYQDNLQGFIGVASGWQRENHTDYQQTRLLEGGLTLMNTEQTQRITAGKVFLRWSQDSVYHPVDLFGRYTQPKSTLGVNRMDDFQREGAPMIRWQGTGDNGAYDVILAQAADDQGWDNAQQAALRGLWQVDDIESSLIAEKTTGKRPRWGATLSQGIGDQWTLYGEYLLSGDREIPQLTQVNPAISLGGDDELPALYRYRQDSHQRSWQKMLLTLRYALQEGGSLEGSFYYNGHGMSQQEWNQWVDIQHSAAQTLTNPRLQQWLAQGNQWIATLGSSAHLMQNFYLRRYYASMRFDSIDRFTQGGVEVNLIYGLEDNSVSLWTEGRYPLNARITAKPFILLQTTSHGEGAISPVSSIVGINISYDFDI
ncbi:Uncharacterised protein [Yersinia intermedia]|uniref:hypothetical protein n=1 Tax=Yersinia intermedia TaxID=631 RepID=UPI0005E77D30|nr:hypothetical protein [Yersinia intermedia]CQJ56174.1 Uncharacterised protein [Yersinia intermedia]